MFENHQTKKQTGKIFIGGLAMQTTEDSLKKYFEENFGEVHHCLMMRDKITGKTRGFGYVTFKDSLVIENILSTPEIYIDGKKVDCKIAIPKDHLNQNTLTTLIEMINEGNINKLNSLKLNDEKQKIILKNKIFVGGLPLSINEDELFRYFVKFGPIEECSIMYDKKTGSPRGFGFIIFKNKKSVESVMKYKNSHCIRGKWIDCKPATPKEYVDQSNLIYSTDINSSNKSLILKSVNYNNKNDHSQSELLFNNDGNLLFLPNSNNNRHYQNNFENENFPLNNIFTQISSNSKLINSNSNSFSAYNDYQQLNHSHHLIQEDSNINVAEFFNNFNNFENFKQKQIKENNNPLNKSIFNPHNLNDLNLNRIKNQHFLKNHQFYEHTNKNYINNSNNLNNNPNSINLKVNEFYGKNQINPVNFMFNPLNFNNCTGHLFPNKNMNHAQEMINNQNQHFNSNIPINDFNFFDRNYESNFLTLPQIFENTQYNSIPMNLFGNESFKNKNYNIVNQSLYNQMGNKSIKNENIYKFNDNIVKIEKNSNNQLDNIIDKNIFFNEFVEYNNCEDISKNIYNISGNEMFKDFRKSEKNDQEILRSHKKDKTCLKNGEFNEFSDNINRTSSIRNYSGEKDYDLNNIFIGEEFKTDSVKIESRSDFSNKSREQMNKFNNTPKESSPLKNTKKTNSQNSGNISKDFLGNLENLIEDKYIYTIKGVSIPLNSNHRKGIIENDDQITINNSINCKDFKSEEEKGNLDELFISEVCGKISKKEEKSSKSIKINVLNYNENIDEEKDNVLIIDENLKQKTKKENSTNTNKLIKDNKSKTKNDFINLKYFSDYNLIDNTIKTNKNNTITSDYYAYKFTSGGESLKLDINFDKEYYYSIKQNKPKVELFKEIDEDEPNKRFEKDSKKQEEQDLKNTIEMFKRGSGCHVIMNKNSSLNESFDKEFNDSYGPKKIMKYIDVLKIRREDRIFKPY